MVSCRVILGRMPFHSSKRNPSWFSFSPAKSPPSLAKNVVLLHQLEGYACCSYAPYSCCTEDCAEGLALHNDDDDDDDDPAKKNHTHIDVHDVNDTSSSCAKGTAFCDNNHNAHGSHNISHNHSSDSCTCHHHHANAQRNDHIHNDELHLQTLANEGQLDNALVMLSRLVTPPSDVSYLALLKACSRNKSLNQVKQVHEHIGQHRSQLTGLLGDYLVVTLAKCGAVEDSYSLATTLPCRTVFSWSAIITAYADSDRGQEALEVLQQMQEEGIQPNNYTYVGLLKACGSLLDLEHGKKLHADTCRNGYASDPFVGNTLVSMYAKCGAVSEAENVFRALVEHDVVSWNAILSAYTEQGEGEKSLRSYAQMIKDSIYPDKRTFAIALQACTTLTETEEAPASMEETIKGMCLEIGQALHANVRKMKNSLCDIVIGNTLVSMYCKCGTISQAESMFSVLPKRDVVSWNAMLSAYVEHSQAEKSLQLYRKMQEDGESPDQLTFVFALQACGILAEKGEAIRVEEGQTNRGISLKIGQALHSDACRRGFASDILIGNALVTMYGKCGTFVETEDLFSVLSHRDTVSWNAMLSTYVEQGWGEKALRLYRHMQRQQATLDDLTLVFALQACSETGSLAVCMQLHSDIVSVGYDGMSSVVTTLIHSYGSCASIINGKAIFYHLQAPDVVTWNALVDGYAGKGHCVSSLCIHEEMKLAGIKPAVVSFTSALSACCHSGLVYEGIQYFESMKRDYGITANLKHFGIMVDLLGRAGAFKKVEEMLLNMPMQADLTIWLSLLGACRTHANVKLARHAFTQAVNLKPKHPTAYVLMSNIYNDAGLQDCAAEVEISRQRHHARRRSGQKWIEHGQELEYNHEKLPQGIFLYHMLHNQ